MKEIKDKLEKLLEFLIMKGSKYGENQRYEMVTVRRKNGTTFQRRQLVGSKKPETKPEKPEKPEKPASKKKAGTKKKPPKTEKPPKEEKPVKKPKPPKAEKPLTQKQSEQVLKDIQAHQSYHNSTPFEFNGHVPHSKRYVGNHSPEQVEKVVKDAGGSVKKIDGVNHYRVKGKDNIMPYYSQEHTGSVIASLTEEEKKKFPKELLDLEAKRYSTSSTFKIQGEPIRKRNERVPKPEWVHEVRDFKRVSGKDGLDSYDWSQMHPNSKSVGGVSKDSMESLAKQGKYNDDHFTALDRIAEEHDKRVGFTGEKKEQFNNILSKVLEERKNPPPKKKIDEVKEKLNEVKSGGVESPTSTPPTHEVYEPQVDDTRLVGGLMDGTHYAKDDGKIVYNSNGKGLWLQMLVSSIPDDVIKKYYPKIDLSSSIGAAEHVIMSHSSLDKAFKNVKKIQNDWKESLREKREKKRKK